MLLPLFVSDLLLANIPPSVTISVVCIVQASSAHSLTTPVLVRLSLKDSVMLQQAQALETFSWLLAVKMPRLSIALSTVSICKYQYKVTPSAFERGQRYYRMVTLKASQHEILILGMHR